MASYLPPGSFHPPFAGYAGAPHGASFAPAQKKGTPIGLADCVPEKGQKAADKVSGGKGARANDSAKSGRSPPNANANNKQGNSNQNQSQPVNNSTLQTHLQALS